jgi:AraC-like DNA-binding protein
MWPTDNPTADLRCVAFRTSSHPKHLPRVATTYHLDYRDINPIIRIAHRLAGPINIPHRQIFDHELVLVTKGATQYVEEAKSLVCVAGDMLVIPPFLWHGFSRSGDNSCEHIAVHFDFATGIPAASTGEQTPTAYEVRLSDGLRLPPLSRHDGHQAAVFANEMAALVRAWEDQQPPSALEARSHLLNILLALLREGRAPAAAAHKTSDARNRRRVERAIRYINQHLPERIAADDLAAATGLSVSQTARLFREQTGHSPMRYLRRARIDRARRLLGDVDLSIKEIAARCGFDDPYHFSRVFHEVDGLPPTLHREALLAGRTFPKG